MEKEKKKQRGRFLAVNMHICVLFTESCPVVRPIFAAAARGIIDIASVLNACKACACREARNEGAAARGRRRRGVLH